MNQYLVRWSRINTCVSGAPEGTETLPRTILPCNSLGYQTKQIGRLAMIADDMGLISGFPGSLRSFRFLSWSFSGNGILSLPWRMTPVPDPEHGIERGRWSEKVSPPFYFCPEVRKSAEDQDDPCYQQDVLCSTLSCPDEEAGEDRNSGWRGLCRCFEGGRDRGTDGCGGRWNGSDGFGKQGKTAEMGDFCCYYAGFRVERGRKINPCTAGRVMGLYHIFLSPSRLGHGQGKCDSGRERRMVGPELYALPDMRRPPRVPSTADWPAARTQY